MTDVNSLKESIADYERQLNQVQASLLLTTEGPDRENLMSLKSDIEELINLTKESLQSIDDKHTNNEDDSIFSDEDNENLSKDSDGDPNNVVTENLINLQNELKSLEGMKCRAPHNTSWSGTNYHNAMICFAPESDYTKITNMQDIEVKVFFMHPVCKEMLPCPYFLDGKCKFSDQQCHFSHGEMVLLASLQEYREPDFYNIKIGSKVLVKQKNEIWERSVVTKLPDDEDNEYCVRCENNSDTTVVGLGDLLPLDELDSNASDASTDNEEYVAPSHSRDEIIQTSLTTAPLSQALGDWEKHTRGIGSKLMSQMGYITGTGLGRRADGRIEPVEIKLLPVGMSLDHCMQLRENAGQGENLLRVERRMHIRKRKMERTREKQYQREKQRERNNIFDFLNTTLANKPKEEPAASSSKTKSQIKTDSNKKLNVTSFEIGENITKLEREAFRLKDSLARHNKGSSLYNNFFMQYKENERKLTQLKDLEKTIIAEQVQRKTKSKLSVF